MLLRFRVNGRGASFTRGKEGISGLSERISTGKISAFYCVIEGVYKSSQHAEGDRVTSRRERHRHM